MIFSDIRFYSSTAQEISEYTMVYLVHSVQFHYACADRALRFLSPHQLTRLKGVFNCAEIMIEIVIEIGKPCSTIQLKVSCPVQCCAILKILHLKIQDSTLSVYLSIVSYLSIFKILFKSMILDKWKILFPDTFPQILYFTQKVHFATVTYTLN